MRSKRCVRVVRRRTRRRQRGGREGVVDMIGDKVSSVASSVVASVGDVGLRMVGLQRTGGDEEKVENEKEVGLSSGVVSYVEDASSILSAAAKLLVKSVNDSMDDPKFKMEVERSLSHVGDVANVFIESGREPFNKAVDAVAEALPKITGAAVSGAIRVGTDAAAAIPGVGAVIEIGKIANDTSKAVSAMVEAGTEATETLSDVFTETAQNFDNKWKEIKEKRQQLNERYNNTLQSIQQSS